jgi:hypothetical protein
VVSLLVSTLAFLVAAYLIKRYLDNSGIPRGTTRTFVIFALALAASYGVAFLVDWVAY